MSVSVQFERVLIDRKELVNETCIIDKKFLYVGQKSSWRLKLKHLVKLDIESRSVELVFSKEPSRVTFLDAIDTEEWEQFQQVLYSRDPSKKNVRVCSFGDKRPLSSRGDIASPLDWGRTSRKRRVYGKQAKKHDGVESDHGAYTIKNDPRNELPLHENQTETTSEARRRRLFKVARTKEEEDDEDALFTSIDNTKHLVSPPEQQQEKKDVQDDNSSRKHQVGHTLDSFFAPKTKRESPPADRTIYPVELPFTPVKSPSTPVKSPLAQDCEWLQHTRTTLTPPSNSQVAVPPPLLKSHHFAADSALSVPSSLSWKRRLQSPPNAKVTTIGRTIPEETPPSRFKGLYNLGNTCYLNATVQSLYSLVGFVGSLHKALETDKKPPLASALDNIFSKLTSSKPVVDPSSLKSAVDDTTDKFVGRHQRDAHEFLDHVVDQLNEELQLPQDLFCLCVEVKLECDCCGYSRTRQETYRHVSLDVCDTIDDALSQFFEKQQLEIKCEKCTKGTTATQTQKVLKRPKALLLHMKRFVMVQTPAPEVDKENAPPEITIAKNKARVKIPQKVSLSPFGFDSNYKLTSVVHHIGSTPSSGHYTADALRDDEWLSMDDTKVSPFARLNTSTAYMVFYSLQE